MGDDSNFMIGYHGVTSDGTITCEYKSRDHEF